MNDRKTIESKKQQIKNCYKMCFNRDLKAMEKGFIKLQMRNHKMQIFMKNLHMLAKSILLMILMKAMQ